MTSGYNILAFDGGALNRILTWLPYLSPGALLTMRYILQLAGSFLLAGYLGEEKTVEGALTRYLGAFDGSYQDRVARYRAEAAQALGR